MIKGTFKRSWDVTKKTFSVMKHDKEILLFPILSVIFSIILFVILVLPIILVGSITNATIMAYFGIFIFYFAIAFVATFFNAGIVHIAYTRFNGGDATFMEGIKAGFKHIIPIFGWSLLTASVGFILKILESQANKKKSIMATIGKILIKLMGVAWAIASVFVVPAIIIKKDGPFHALKSSIQTMKKTWGESLVKFAGVAIVRSVINTITFFLFLVPSILLFFYGNPMLGFFLLGIYIFITVIVSIVLNSADTVFNTALFMYANEGKVPEVYSKEDMSGAFKSS